MTKTTVNINGLDVTGWELTTGWIIGIVFISIAVIAVCITGIISAAKTKDVGVQVGRLLLHLFIWGGFVAAIVYAVKASGNKDVQYHQPQPQNNEAELLKRIEELEKQNKKK